MHLYDNIVNTLNLLSKLSLIRIINVFLLKVSFQISVVLNKAIHWGYPDSISVEPTTNCNLNCLECPSGQETFQRPTGNISTDLFSNIIKQTCKYLMHLNLYYQGEPFLHPNIFELVQIAKTKNIYVTISTNGHFLDITNINNILDNKIDKLIISIDGLSQESYNKYRQNGNLETVLDGINLLVVEKEKRKTLKPYIEIQFIPFKHNELEISKLNNFFKPYKVQRIRIKKAFIDNFTSNKNLIPESDSLSRYSIDDTGNYKIRNKLKNRCWRSWHSPVITWDGKLIPCCFDKHAKYTIGDINSSPFKAIWKSAELKKFQNKILHSRKSIDICRNCTEGMKYRI